MSSVGTIESSNKKIGDKLENLRLVFEQLDCLGKFLDQKNVPYEEVLASKFLHLNLIKADFEDLETRYGLVVAPILTDYYSGSNKFLETQNTKKYYQLIDSENFLSKIEQFAKKAQRVLENQIAIYVKMCSLKLVLSRDDPVYPIVNKIRRNLEAVRGVKMVIASQANDFRKCRCGASMVMSPMTSELHCTECKIVNYLEGTAALEMNKLSEKSAPKKGGHEFERHFNAHMNHIQGLDNKTFPPEHLAAMEMVIKRDSLDLDNVEEMRKVLKEVKLTGYNNNSPLLMKTLVGRQPTVLPPHIRMRFTVKFVKINKYLMQVLPPGANRKCYSFFIYRIAYDEMKAAERAKNKELVDMMRNMFNYIHLQSADTNKQNEKIYREVCKIADPEDGLTYEPIDW